MELLKRGFTHNLQHMVLGMLRCDFQTTAHMMQYKLSCVLADGLVQLLVLPVVQKHVVSHAASYVAMSDLGICRHAPVYVQKGGMVAVQVGAYCREYAGRTLAFLTGTPILTMHHVHVCARTSQITQRTVKVRHGCDFVHLLHDALLAAVHDELALMSAYRAECTSAKTSSMHVYAELDHLVGGNPLSLVFGVGQTCVWQVEAMVHLVCSKRRIGGIDNYVFPTCLLDQPPGMYAVALFLDMAEVLGMQFQVFQRVLVRIEHNIIILWIHIVVYCNGLRQCFTFNYGFSECLARNQGFARCIVIVKTFVIGIQHFRQPAYQLYVDLVAHAVCNQVGIRVAQYRWTQPVLPVIVMHQASQRSLYASQNNGNVRIQLAYTVRIYNRRVFRTHIMPAVRRICILASQAFCSSIFVHHRIHTAGTDSEEQPGTPQSLEVPEVSMPGRLGYDTDAKSLCFQDSSDYGNSKRRMVDIGICREQNNIRSVPAPQLHLLPCSWQPVG